MKSTVRFFYIACFFIISIFSSACTHFPPRLYRIDIQQGSDIKEDMIKKLRRGMSKEQVKEILGSPTLPHVLDTERFDYYFSFKPGMKGKPVKKHFVVFFKNGVVDHWKEY